MICTKTCWVGVLPWYIPKTVLSLGTSGARATLVHWLTHNNVQQVAGNLKDVGWALFWRDIDRGVGELRNLKHVKTPIHALPLRYTYVKITWAGHCMLCSSSSVSASAGRLAVLQIRSPNRTKQRVYQLPCNHAQAPVSLHQSNNSRYESIRFLPNDNIFKVQVQTQSAHSRNKIVCQFSCVLACGPSDSNS